MEIRKTCILLITGFFLNASGLTAQHTWTGTNGTDWFEMDNWSPATIPTATDYVTIPGAAANQPIISASGDVANSVHVQTGGSLTIQNMGSQTINGSFNHGTFSSGFRNEGTVANSGQLVLGNTGSIGTDGLRNSDTFHNYSGAEISIDRSSATGLRNASGTFTNAAKKIKIGPNNSVGGFGISNEGVSDFQNNTFTALIKIVSNGPIDYNAAFTNAGTIIENASGKSSISSNLGLVQNFNSDTFTIGKNEGTLTTTTFLTDYP